MNLAYQVNCSLVIDDVSEKEAAFLYTALAGIYERHKFDEDNECAAAAERLLKSVFRTVVDRLDQLSIDRFDLPYLRIALHDLRDDTGNPFIAAYADDLLNRLGGFGAKETELYHELASVSYR